MAKEFDIMYYEYMMESIQADREIKELLLGAKAAGILNEACEELSIYEANIFNTVFEKIKEIFDRVIDFFKRLFDKVTKERVCVPDEKLIKKVEDKIKDISNEDKNNFILREANIADNCNKWLSEQSLYGIVKNLAYSDLNAVEKEFNNFLDGKGPTDYEDRYNKLIKSVTEANKDIDESTTKDALMKGAKDVSFNDIKTILILYKDKEISSKLKNNLVEVTKKMQTKQKEFSKGKGKEFKTSDISYFQNAITQLTNLIIKLEKSRLQVSNILFHNQEAILRKFVAYKSNAEIDSSKAVAVK